MAGDKVQRENREKRVAQALRANLKRRKAQTRSRKATAEEQELADAAETEDATGADGVEQSNTAENGAVKDPNDGGVKNDGKTK